MPSEKPRSKEDTWRPEELEKSLKEIRGDRRSDRSRDDGGDRDRRHRPTDDGKERRSKDKSRRSEGDRRADQSTEKESDRMKREERRIKDEEREERHRRKAEERRKAEKERDNNINGDENNHNDRDRDRRRDGSERRKKRDTEGNDVEDRHKDGSKRRSHRDSDDRGYDDDERRRRHKNDDDRRHKADDDDRRHSRKNEEERRRSHKDEDRRRSHKDDDDGSGGRRRSDREKERRSQNEGEERRRSHKNDNDDGGNRRRSDREKERRSHDEGEERTRSHRYDDDGGGSRRRSDREKERRSHNEGEEKRRSHKDDDTAHRRRSHKDEDDDSRKRSYKNDEERRSHKSDDRRHSRREDEDHRGDDDGEYKRHREIKQHRNDSSEGEKHRDSNDQRDQKIEKVEPDDNGADNYDDDFEDYEEDFEDDADESDTQNDKPETEVDAVLKALDAENNRLMAESRRSNGSDSTELSDERFRSSEAPSKQRTFINFVSAKQMVLSDKASLKTRTRGRDLLQLIDLDVSAYDMFDLPPVKEYDLYIRDFGRTDTAQVYVQTNEDAIDRDIQTEELEYVEKWSQHPCEESAASGRGDGETEGDEDLSLRPIQTSDLTKLSRFIHRAGQVVSILLEEESGGDNHQPTSQSSISVSQGFSQLANPPFLQGRCVDQMCFSPSQPNLLLTLYSPCQDKEAFSDICSVPGVICVWNISEPSVPQKILVCDSVPTSCCYSPTSTALVFAGMVDGALVLWDVREPSSLHTSTRLGEEEYSLRHPTYNTAGVLGEDNHQSAVVMVTPTLPPVMSSKSATSLLDDTGGASYQIVSVDQTGTVNLWVVAQISSPDQAGSESDLGLAPGGRVKLLRSSSFVLDNPVREMWARTELRVTCLQLSPGDPNQFVTGTDSGLIVHAARFGAKPFPRCYRGPTESPVDVTCIDYSPFCNPCFLSGCSDGTVRLYNTSSGKPLIMWPARDIGTSVVGVQWSRSRPAVFYILYDNSTLAVYDLVETDARPVALDNIQTGRALGLAVSPDPYCRGQGQPDKHPHLVLTLETGKSEVHSVAKNFVEQQPFEEDFIKSYLDRF